MIGSSSLEDAREPSDVDHLDVLSCGPIPPNPAELLASKRMEEILHHANQLYDMVILDTPPALAVADARILANIVEGSLIVVRSNITKIEEAEHTVDMIKDSKARLLGTILNDREKTNANYTITTETDLPVFGRFLFLDKINKI